jgi:hypothetical protein
MHALTINAKCRACFLRYHHDRQTASLVKYYFALTPNARLFPVFPPTTARLHRSSNNIILQSTPDADLLWCLVLPNP